MRWDPDTDITVSLWENWRWFTDGDAAEVRYRLKRQFEPKAKAEAAVVNYDYTIIWPADVVITVASHFVANLDTVGLNVISNAIYDAFRNYVWRSKRISVKVRVEVIKEADKHTRETEIDIEGDIYDLESIEKLLKQAMEVGRKGKFKRPD